MAQGSQPTVGSRAPGHTGASAAWGAGGVIAVRGRFRLRHCGGSVDSSYPPPGPSGSSRMRPSPTSRRRILADISRISRMRARSALSSPSSATSSGGGGGKRRQLDAGCADLLLRRRVGGVVGHCLQAVAQARDDLDEIEGCQLVRAGSDHEMETATFIAREDNPTPTGAYPATRGARY